jgi:hypothetical protein
MGLFNILGCAQNDIDWWERIVDELSSTAKVNHTIALKISYDK